VCFTKCPHFVVEANEFINNGWVHAKNENFNRTFFTGDV
jgi:hypothetical protein